MIPHGLVKELVKLVNQIVFIFRIGGFFFVVVASVSGIKSADIVLSINLVTVKNNNHSLLDRFLILVQEQQKVYFIIDYRIADCRNILIFCFKFLTLVFNLANYPYYIYLTLWALFQNSIDPSDLSMIYWEVNVLFLEELRISIENYLKFPFF